MSDWCDLCGKEVAEYLNKRCPYQICKSCYEGFYHYQGAVNTKEGMMYWNETNKDLKRVLDEIVTYINNQGAARGDSLSELDAQHSDSHCSDSPGKCPHKWFAGSEEMYCENCGLLWKDRMKGGAGTFGRDQYADGSIPGDKSSTSCSQPKPSVPPYPKCKECPYDTRVKIKFNPKDFEDENDD